MESKSEYEITSTINHAHIAVHDDDYRTDAALVRKGCGANGGLSMQ